MSRACSSPSVCFFSNRARFSSFSPPRSGSALHAPPLCRLHSLLPAHACPSRLYHCPRSACPRALIVPVSSCTLTFCKMFPNLPVAVESTRVRPLLMNQHLPPRCACIWARFPDRASRGLLIIRPRSDKVRFTQDRSLHPFPSKHVPNMLIA